MKPFMLDSGTAGSRPCHRRKEQGFSLVTIAACSVVMIAMLGLTFDLARAYVIKSELQAYVDSAALAAAFELDGTAAGITRANNVAGTGPVTGGAAPNYYDFDTKTVASPVASFATVFAGPYAASGAAANASRFVKVTASANAPLFFLPILPNIVSPLAVSATAIAGQGLQTSIGEGASPFSPDAHNPNDPTFGFTPGLQYTLKWPPLGQRGKPNNSCNGDGAFVPPNTSADRGYIDVGQGSGNAGLHDAIVNSQDFLAQPYTIGSQINWVTGNKNVKPGIDERFAQDTDQTSATYSQYTGNGRRILTVPVNNDADPALVVGFAAFFMPPGMCGPSNISPCCAEYIGPAVEFGSHGGAGGGGSGGGSGAGLYQVKLFQ